MPPFIFLVRIKNRDHNIFLPLPLFLLTLLWLLALAPALLVGMLGALMLLNREGGKGRATGRKLLNAFRLYLKMPGLYCAMGGFKVDVTNGDERVLMRAI